MTKMEDSTKPDTYAPSEKDKKLIAQVDADFEAGKRARQSHESQWYTTSAFLRGQQWSQWDSSTGRLVTTPAPSYRIRRVFNLMLPKHRARISKFLKNRPRPEVRAATQDVKDILNARMTTKALDFTWRKARMEEKFQDVVNHAAQCAHGYWWYSWDPTIISRVRYRDEQTGQFVTSEAQLGDVCVEVGSAFEVLVPDTSCTHLGEQPWIIRMKMRSLDWIRAHHPKTGAYVASESDDDSSLQYQKAIGDLPPTSTNAPWLTSTGNKDKKDNRPEALVKERFEHPCANYPKGRYTVVSNGVLLKNQDELPYQMWDMSNPYPVTDFVDAIFANQYWSPTINEQAISPQRQYNLLRSKFEENIKGMVFPKLLVARQHQLPPNSWTGEANEIVTYVAHPGIPPPQTWTPANISSDVWRALEVLRGEIDSIYHIYPEAEGRIGQATSGFQTNLLQEATDAVHGPDIRAHERGIEEAALKIRRLMKLMYDVPRLLTITSKEEQVDAFEFGSDHIDDYADIVVQAGSGLPDLKGARIQMALELRNSRIFGNPDDPEVNRRVLQMMDIGDLTSIYADARRDEERSRLENVDFSNGTIPELPLFCDNHMIHSKVHTDQLKSSEYKQWPVDSQTALIDHIIIHALYINPQSAQQIAAIYQRPIPSLPGITAPLPGQPPPQQAMAPGMEQPMQPGMEGQPPMSATRSGADQFNPEFGFGPQGSNVM